MFLKIAQKTWRKVKCEVKGFVEVDLYISPDKSPIIILLLISFRLSVKF